MAAHHTGTGHTKVQRFGPHRMGEKGPARRMNQGRGGHGRYQGKRGRRR